MFRIGTCIQTEQISSFQALSGAVSENTVMLKGKGFLLAVMRIIYS